MVQIDYCVCREGLVLAHCEDCYKLQFVMTFFVFVWYCRYYSTYSTTTPIIQHSQTSFNIARPFVWVILSVLININMCHWSYLFLLIQFASFFSLYSLNHPVGKYLSLCLFYLYLGFLIVVFGIACIITVIMMIIIGNSFSYSPFYILFIISYSHIYFFLSHYQAIQLAW